MAGYIMDIGWFARLCRNVQLFELAVSLTSVFRGLTNSSNAPSHLNLHVSQGMYAMRTERNKDGSYNVWMYRSQNEVSPLFRGAHSVEAEIALRLMADCGLRVGEVGDVTPADIKRRPDGQNFGLEVTAGKDTTGEYDEGKQRETWLSRDFEARINRFVQSADRCDDEPVVSAAKRTVQSWVSRAADAAADETGVKDYRRVSSHDLRRAWAHDLLVEQSVSPRIVMALGGWSSYDAIEPYLAAPSEGNIVEAMESAGY